MRCCMVPGSTSFQLVRMYLVRAEKAAALQRMQRCPACLLCLPENHVSLPAAWIRPSPHTRCHPAPQQKVKDKPADAETVGEK